MRGFQVAPAEIEAVLHGHPAVEDCAVFGVPDTANGEAIVAAVKTCSPVEADELIALVADRLASYKRPSRVVFVPEIPRLPSGKVLRRVLKERCGRPSDELNSGSCGRPRPSWPTISDPVRLPISTTRIGSPGWRRPSTSTGFRTLRSDGASGVEVAIVAEEFARGLVDVPFLGPVLADDLTRALGREPSAPDRRARVGRPDEKRCRSG